MTGILTPADILGIANETDPTRGAAEVGYNNNTVKFFLDEIANGTATPISTPTGTETVPASRGAGLKQLTSQSIANLAVNAPSIGNLLGYQVAFRNRIINGNCNIAQRPSLAVPLGTSGYGGPDRFFAGNGNGAGGSFTQSQGSITYSGVMKNAVVQTVTSPILSTSTTSYWAGIIQAIEGYNSYDLLGKPVVVSFIFETNVSGTYSFSIRDYTNTNSWVSTFMATANTPVKVIFPVSMLPLTLTTPNTTSGGLYISIGAINTGTYQTSTLNTWEPGGYFTAASAVGTDWGATTGNYIAVTELQVEEGTVATPYENTPYSLEFSRCQRYYQTLLVTMEAYQTGGSSFGFTPQYPTLMRVTPTYTPSGGTYVNSYGFSALPSIGSAYVWATTDTLAYCNFGNWRVSLSAEL